MTSSCTGTIKYQYIDNKGNVFMIRTDCTTSPSYLITTRQTDPMLDVAILYELSNHDLKRIQESNGRFTLKTNTVFFNNERYIAPYVLLDKMTMKLCTVEKLDEHTDFSAYLDNVDKFIPTVSLDFGIKSNFKEYESDLLFVRIISQFMYKYFTEKNIIYVDKEKAIAIYNNVLYKFHKEGMVKYDDMLIDDMFYVFDEDIKHKLESVKYPIIENLRVSRDYITTSDSDAVNRLYKTRDDIIRSHIGPSGGFFTVNDDIYSVSNIHTSEPVSTHDSLDHFFTNNDHSGYIGLFGDVYSITKIDQ